MKTKYRVPRTLMILALATMAWSPNAARSQVTEPVYVEILADRERTSPDPLEPFDIRFIVHANGNKIQGMVFAGVFEFTNGNIIGTIDEYPNGDAQIVYSAQTVATFASRAWNTGYGKGYDPDTLLLGLTSFSSPWTGTGEMFRIHVTPTDTGTIQYDSLPLLIPPSSQGGIAAQDPLGGSLPVVVVHSPVHVPPQPDPVRFRISTSGNSDTLYANSPARIFMNVDAAGNTIQGVVTVLLWEFSIGNMVGAFNSDIDQNTTFSDEAVSAFESRILYSTSGLGGHAGTSPDTSVAGLTSFDTSCYKADSWIWSVDFTPLDTGTVFLTTDVFVPPMGDNMAALDSLGGALPSNFIPGRIVVRPCPYAMMGDVNQDAVITSSDLIYLVNYLFKSGPDPLPERSVADVNCSGGLGGADLIYLVNHLFKGGAEPCACIVRRI